MLGRESAEPMILAEQAGSCRAASGSWRWGRCCSDPRLEHVTRQLGVFAGFRLTIVCMLPVALALSGTSEQRHLTTGTTRRAPPHAQGE
jgi:hypothetical protein